jgi:putative FmdB family regulatory protein
LPTYEYRCSRGHQYERIEGFDAPVEQTCPTCGSVSRRQISLPAVIFKGPGFYSTDNRKGYASGGNGSRSSAGSDGGSEKSDGESKADSGSAPKAEAKTD